MIRCIVVLSAIFSLIFTQDDVVEDTQFATCQINSTEVQTTANATVKRQLKGVCTYKQIELKFQELEEKLLAELGIIKQLLEGDGKTVRTNDYYDYEERSLKIGGPVSTTDDPITSVTEQVFHTSSWVRTEIDHLNNTIHVHKGEKLFVYYWEIPEIDSILPKNGVHIRSADFYVLGHQLCLQLYPNHLPDYLAIQLRPSSNFFKKHKFAILDHFDGSTDIVSQVFGGVGSYEALYKVPYAKLQERNYLHDDKLVIKLTIFLNS
ncbi:uncharacterized protein LOC103313245 [Tribolium castaneum]|uniref:MATH domain-containing protein n=1 Tax=Tribolium castaneum TaxID=7070 RepID=A0A139WHE0_TRICA|nr:PREDICTED: uncharacterized protein LOC103313245 [Tribolium castaneum]KYB27336.1 hypothetical protein TcasGA2_TC034704 [Tribolium castaneum]|eukprot:XP_008194244.1 PREDICTED: uncharacterized protein LOC103313245 [Tribolium castaneum]